MNMQRFCALKCEQKREDSQIGMTQSSPAFVRKCKFVFAFGQSREASAVRSSLRAGVNLVSPSPLRFESLPIMSPRRILRENLPRNNEGAVCSRTLFGGRAMKSVLRPWLGAFALFVFLAAAFTRPCFAENWQALGTLPNSLDKVYVDTDSVEQVDGYRIVRLMTVYPQPRTNIHNILMDRHIQVTALDCGKKMFFGIQMFGYLNGKRIGSGPAEADWKTKLVPIGNNPFEVQLFATACSLPLTNGRAAPPRLLEFSRNQSSPPVPDSW